MERADARPKCSTDRDKFTTKWSEGNCATSILPKNQGVATYLCPQSGRELSQNVDRIAEDPTFTVAVSLNPISSRLDRRKLHFRTLRLAHHTFA